MRVLPRYSAGTRLTLEDSASGLQLEGTVTEDAPLSAVRLSVQIDGASVPLNFTRPPAYGKWSTGDGHLWWLAFDLRESK